MNTPQSKLWDIMRIGLIPIAILPVALVLVLILKVEEPIFNPPYLALILQAIFVLGTSIAVAFVSGKDYIGAGSLNLVFLGSALLVNGVITTVSVTPLGLSSNTVVTFANLGTLTSAVIQFLGSIITFIGTAPSRIMHRKAILSTAYVTSILLIGSAIGLALSNWLPVFLTPTGPTLQRLVIILVIITLLFASCLLFSWQYFKVKSPILYWYSLALALYGIALVAAFFTIRLGDIMNWTSRLAIYLSGTYFLLAVLNRGSKNKDDVTVSQRWVETFATNREQSALLFNKMMNGFVYLEVVTNKQGKPVDHIILDANDSFEQITGLTKEQVVGKRASTLFSGIEDDPANLIGFLGTVGLTGEPALFERYFGPLKKWFSVSAYSPKKGYVVTLFEDVTARKKAEEERASIARFPSENPNIVLRVDRNGVIMYCNPAGQFLMEEWNCKIGEQVPNHLSQFISDALASNRIIKFEETNREQIFSFQVVPIDEADYLNIYGINVTERKKAEEALRKAHDELELRVQERTARLKEANEALQAEVIERTRMARSLKESEERYRRLIETSQEGVWVVDAEAKTTYVNKRLTEMLGYTEEELLGRSALDLLDASDRAKAEKRLRAGKEWLKDVFDIHYRRKDGSDLWVLASVNPLFDEKNNFIGVLGMLTDVTEKRKFEGQLLRAQRMESIGMLANGIAHDLNNTLSPIMISLELLREKVKDDEDGQTTIDLLEKSGVRATNLVKQIQSFARGAEGEREPLQVANIISEVAQMVKETFPRNIDIKNGVDSNSSNLSIILGDATQMDQVLMNLCVNARDAMPNGGLLSISAENFYIDENYARMNIESKVGRYVVITVSDTGTGIPSEILDKIFDPFFTTKPFGKGTGLGLPTALAIIKGHGGFINVYSEVGKGSAFKVYLPAIKTTETQGVEEESGTPTGQGETILLVEDEDSVRETTALALEKHGYKVLSAKDGVEAVAVYRQNRRKIKVVIMDLMMPSMDGATSIKALRKMNSKVKVIAVSGLAQNEYSDTMGMIQAFLPKPYTAKKLLITIKETLNTK